MDQNVSIEEVLNNSFSTIYDVLKLVDSKVNDEVINSINNNAESDEIVRLQLFKEAYIKAIQETKNLQRNVVSLINYNEKSIEEIKSEVAAMENASETEMVNEEVPVEEETVEETTEVENENVEMPEDEMAVEQDISMPEVNETPIESEETVVEDNTDQVIEEEATEVQEEPIEENTEVEISDDASEITEEAPAEEAVVEENTSVEEAVAEEETPIEEGPVEDDAPAEEVTNEEDNNQELVIPSVSDTPAEEGNTAEEVTNEENSEHEPVIPLVEDSNTEENATEEEAPVEISFDGVNQEEQSNDQQDGVVLPVVEASEEDVKDSVDSTKIYKTSNDSTRVILTTSVQYSNLEASKETNKALLSAKGMFGSKEKVINDDNIEEEAMKNGLVEESAESLQKQVEELIAQAQSLYKEGKAQEAQELMNQVAVLNEKIKNLSSSSEEDEKQFQLTA